MAWKNTHHFFIQWEVTDQRQIRRTRLASSNCKYLLLFLIGFNFNWIVCTICDWARVITLVFDLRHSLESRCEARFFFHPLTSKMQNLWSTPVFPHFWPATCICLEFWLTQWIVCVLFDWPEVGFVFTTHNLEPTQYVEHQKHNERILTPSRHIINRDGVVMSVIALNILQAHLEFCRGNALIKWK